MKKLLFFIIFSALITFSTQAQRYLIDEIGINVGYLNFQGDYGQRSEFSTTLGNAGVMLNSKIYLNFLDNYRTNCYACQHFKFDLGVDMGYSNLSFDRAYTTSDSPATMKIKAISGNVYLLNMAFNVEHHFSNLRNINIFSNTILNSLDPYMGLGLGSIFYSVNVDSELGDIEKDPSILPTAFQGGRAFSEKNITASANLELGIRYRISDNFQLNLNNKWMYFFTDRIDGLVPNPRIADNLYNDWLFTSSLGLIVFIY